jgi:hypothetical protein
MPTSLEPSENPGSPSFLTTQDLADLLRTTPATVAWWRHTGYGPHGVRVGRRVLYPAGGVRNWLESLNGGGSAS